jgi:serine/threonine protein phosphatase PrpC
MQELLDQGRLTKEEVFDHPQRSLLTHALMGDSGIYPVLVSYEIKSGDQFLICSDGLTNLLSDYEIGKIIEGSEGKDLVAALIAEVKVKGAPDNITIIWAQVVTDEKNIKIKKLGAANE